VTARDDLDRLASALVEDILETSDEDILAEVEEDYTDPEAHMAEMRALLERVCIAADEASA